MFEGLFGCRVESKADADVFGDPLNPLGHSQQIGGLSMRFLDTREQKSPRFLIDAFPDLEIKPLTVGDYFSGSKTDMWIDEMAYYEETGKLKDKPDQVWLTGNLVEIKLGDDFGIHTEQLKRFRDELYRMACYRQKNPHVQLHAVWVTQSLPGIDRRLFHHYCYKYHVWGHIFYHNTELIGFLKELDQPSQYKEFEPYIKRSHEEPTILAKMLRQFPGISSEKAIAIADRVHQNPFSKWFLKRGDHWENSIRDESLKNHPWRQENVGPVEYKEVPL